MGTLTRLQLRQEVLKNLGDLPDTGNNTTRVNRFLDFAQARIAREESWRELQLTGSIVQTNTSTPADDRFLNITGLTIRDILGISRIIGSEEILKLVRLTPRQFVQLGLNSTTESNLGDARHYMVWNELIELWPIPNRTWTAEIRHTVWPVDFPNDAATSDLDRKDDILVTLATHMSFHSLGQRVDAIQWFAIYQDLLRAAVKDNGEEPDLLIMNRGIREDRLTHPDPVADPFVKRIV